MIVGVGKRQVEAENIAMEEIGTSEFLGRGAKHQQRGALEITLLVHMIWTRRWCPFETIR